MALRGITATSLKDEARLIGLVLPAGGIAQIDVSEEQVADVQAAIDRGDVSVIGMTATPAKAAPQAPQKGK